MLNNDMTRSFKNGAYSAFADVTRALGSARRLELVDLLVQRPRSVQDLAHATGRSIASTSQHLRALRAAHLVATTRQGTTIEYRLAPGVEPVLVALRRLAFARSAEVERHQRDWFTAAGAPDTITREELAPLLRMEQALLVDVRPEAEYLAGHIEGARSLPVDELVPRILELPADRLLVACCRGPYCAFAADAVVLLRSNGLRAVRFEDGVAEWRTDGGTIAAGRPS